MAGTGKGPLRIAIEDFLSTFKLGEILHDWYSQLFEKFEDDLIRTNPEIFSELSDIPELERYLHLKPILARVPGHQTGIAVLSSILIAVVIGMVMTSVSVVSTTIRYAVSRKIPQSRFDPSTAVAMINRNPSITNDLISGMMDLGWSLQNVELLRMLLKERVDENTLVTMWLRGEIDDGRINNELKLRGWEDTSIEWLKKNRMIIPNVSDLISLAVREAWNDEIANRFQYDADLPGEVSNWGKKQGLDPDWIKRYWRAHWQLPGVQQGYEMLHRLRPGISKLQFTVDDMRALLQTADYPPFWRDRLIEISYAPYTRVDVRRMYKLGILNEQDVYNSYRDLGYNDEHAHNLAQFTIKYETGTDATKPDEVFTMLKPVVVDAYQRKQIDRNTALKMFTDLHVDADYAEAIIKTAEFERTVQLIPDWEKENIASLKKLVDAAYTEGLISREEAQSALSKLGMSGDVVTVLLDNDDYEYNHQVLVDALKDVGGGYINGAYSYNDTVSKLGKLNITGKQQDRLFADWNAQKETRVRRATETEFRTAYKQGWITDAEYKAALLELGYCDKDADMLWKIYTQEPPAAA